MKLAKKMLACAMALAMVAALALTAFAAAPVVTVTAPQYANVGDEVTVTVAATGMAGLMSADLVISYDATALEYVAKSAAKPAGAEYDMGAGDKIEDGVVTWSLMYMEEAKVDSALVTLKFKVLKEGDSTVSVKYESWDGTDEPAEASAVVSQKVVTTEAPTTVAPTTVAPTTVAPTEAGSEAHTTGTTIPETGEAGVAAIAGVMALAAVAFVATRKKDEE